MGLLGTQQLWDTGELPDTVAHLPGVIFLEKTVSFPQQ